MTVGELKAKLGAIAPETEVVIIQETEDSTEFFGIGDVTVKTGTPRRHSNGKIGFTFDGGGPATWCLVSAEEG